MIEQHELAASGHDPDALVTRALGLVEEVMKSPVWRRITAGAERHVEVPFVIAVDAAAVPPDVALDVGVVADPAATPPSVLVRGQIDLVFRDLVLPPPAGMSDWVVVDWKTTSVAAADLGRLADRYRPQVRLYAACWATILGGGAATED